MKRLAVVYFSGTGNTHYAVKRLCDNFGAAGIECCLIPIENYEIHKSFVQSADTILTAYPIYGSDMPYFVRNFIIKNKEDFSDKKLITLCTQFIFSGDGAALCARLLKKQRINHIASIHISLPSNISDLLVFKVKNGNENSRKIEKANKKIDICAKRILKGKSVRNGRHIYSWALGFLGQRLLWHYFVEKSLRAKLKIDKATCIRCGKCVNCCPTKNIVEADEGITSLNQCTACYRCINLCPRKAISLLSKKKPKEQYKGIE